MDPKAIVLLDGVIRAMDPVDALVAWAEPSGGTFTIEHRCGEYEVRLNDGRRVVVACEFADPESPVGDRDSDNSSVRIRCATSDREGPRPGLRKTVLLALETLHTWQREGE